MRLNPRVTQWFTGDSARNLHALEEETGRRFFFEGSDGLPLVSTSRSPRKGRPEEIEQQAVPFQAGDEVHVHIVEPHMYNEDDAVAKVDGYVIEVLNAIPFVGEKKLVRIEEAGRTGARAALVGAEAEEAEEAGQGAREGDQGARPPQAAPRRRPRSRPRSPAPKPVEAPEAERPHRRPREDEDETLESKLGAAAAGADGAVRVPRPKPASDLTRCPNPLPPTPSSSAGGTQHRVEEGTTLLVDRLKDDEGAAIDLVPLLYCRRQGHRVRGRRPRPRQGQGEDRRSRARPQAAHLQVQAQARLQAHHGPPLRS